MIKNIIVSILVLLLCLINFSSLKKDPSVHSSLKKLPFRAFGLAQKWTLFAPNPSTVNLKTIVVGETQSGAYFDLQTQAPYNNQLDFAPRPAPNGYNHHSYNLGLLSTFLGISSYRNFGEALCYDISKYYANQWNNKFSDKIVRVHFVQAAIKTLAPDTYGSKELNTLYVVTL